MCLRTLPHAFSLSSCACACRACVYTDAQVVHVGADETKAPFEQMYFKANSARYMPSVVMFNRAKNSCTVGHQVGR